MELIKEELSVDRFAADEKMQLMLEGEIALEEDIKSIISKRADCFVSFCGQTGNRLEFSGGADIDLVCMDKNGHVFNVSHSEAINDGIVAEGILPKCMPQFSCSTASLECELINGRKIGYKLLCDVGCRVFDTYTALAVTKIEGADSVFEKTANYAKFVSGKPVTIKIKDNITIGRDMPNIENIADMTVQPVNMVTECVDGGLSIKGGLKVTLLYNGDEGNDPPESYSDEIEINGSAEIEDAEAGMVCSPEIQVENSFYNILEDEEGESRIAEIECELCIYPNIFEDKTLTLPEDACIKGRLLDVKRENIKGFKYICSNKSRCPIKQPIETDGPDMLRVYNAFGTVTVDDTRVEEDRTVVSGVADINVLYVTGNDDAPVSGFTGSIPFEQVLETRGSQKGMKALISASPQHIGFNMLSQREIEIRGMIAVDCIILEDTDFDVITDIEEKDLPEGYLDSLPSAAVYVVQCGDSLWKLAKRFNTTVEEIAKINDIEDPDIINVGDKLIILKG